MDFSSLKGMEDLKCLSLAIVCRGETGFVKPGRLDGWQFFLLYRSRFRPQSVELIKGILNRAAKVFGQNGIQVEPDRMFLFSKPSELASGKLPCFRLHQSNGF